MHWVMLDLLLAANDKRSFINFQLPVACPVCQIGTLFQTGFRLFPLAMMFRSSPFACRVDNKL
jgi:hypothetical protein